MKHFIALLLTLTASLAATPKCIWQTNADGTISAQNGNIVVHPSGGITGGSASSSSDFLGFEYHLDLAQPFAGNISAVITDSDDWNYSSSFLAQLAASANSPYSILRLNVNPISGNYSALEFWALSGSQVDGGIESTVSRQSVWHLFPNLDDGENAIAYRFTTRNPFSLGRVAVFGNGANEVSVTGLGAVKTAAPDGGTAQPFKIGSVIAGTVQLVTDAYVQVEIGGQIVKLAVVQEVP